MKKNIQIYNELKEWIESKPGGFIHPSLTLFEFNTDTNYPNRGIKSTSAITEKTLLIRLPTSFALSGQDTEKDSKATTSKEITNATPSLWLRCIGQLIVKKKLHDLGQVDNLNQSKFSPYFNSLPTSFDTLQTWSTTELEEYLGGTALGKMALLDRRDNLTQVRFEKSVKPYVELLRNHINLSNENKEIDEVTWEDFLWASQCLSTRGFHMEMKGGDESSSSYSGPYLLPYIDLLNHDPKQKCTTLQRINNSGSENESFFQMIAERNIESGEEIFHSYYSHEGETNHDSPIPSAQLLQTFGFVSNHHVQEAVQFSFNKRKRTSIPVLPEPDHSTKAILSIDQIVNSCKEVASSTWVEKFRKQNQILEEEENPFWDPLEAWEEKEFHLKNKQAILSDQILASNTDEIVTCCVMLLLPQDAFHDLFVNDENPALLETNQIFAYASNSSDLDEEDSDDDSVWLGTLVGMAVIDVIKRHVEKYDAQASGNLISRLKNKINCLSELLKKQERSTESGRKMAGLTIQIEEQKSLEYLGRTALEWIKTDVET